MPCLSQLIVPSFVGCGEEEEDGVTWSILGHQEKHTSKQKI
jgi:hypothetical protein